MPNLDPWINQNNSNKNEEHMIATKTITNKLENDLLSIKQNAKKMIHPNSHPTYNERLLKIIKLIDQTLEKYKTTANTKMTNEENEEQEVIIIEDIIQELNKKKKNSYKQKAKSYTKR